MQTTHSANDSGNEFSLIQIARYFAAVLVVVDHALLDFIKLDETFNTNMQEAAWRLGGFGVYIFFIISGFVITYANRESFRDGNKLATGNFLLKRIIRILPIYWAVTFAFIVKMYLVGVPFTWMNVITSLLFIPYGCFHDQCGRPLLELGWTLQFEMFFYLMFALVLPFKKRMALPILLTLLFMMALIGVFKGRIALPVGYYFDPILIYFISGIVLGCFVESSTYIRLNEWANRASLKNYSLGFVLMFLVCIIAIVYSPKPYLELFDFSAAIILVILCLRKVRSDSFGGTFFTKWIFLAFIVLGAASYSMYLTHIFILGAAKRIFNYSNLQPDYFLYLSLMVTISTILALICYFLIEKPIQKLLKRLFKV